MINEENLNKMYNGLIDNKKLTTKELNSYGFNSKDLFYLIENGVLERIKRGYYSFISVDDLFYYGKKLISLKNYAKATACFEKCYEIDQSHSGVCFQLFLRAIQSRNYKKVFEYFEKFYYSDNKHYNKDSNFYLYLLSMITEIPEQHREYVKYLRLEDIRIDFSDKRYEDVYLQNRIRILSLNKKFNFAYKQLNDLIKKHGKLGVQDILVKRLLSQVIEVQNKLRKHIINLAISKKYDEIVIYLEEIQKQHYLSVTEDCILSLAKDISEFMRTGIIPKIQIESTNKLFDAIKGKNYELALSLSNEYIEKNKINSNNNAIFLLINDITELIRSKKKISQKTSNSDAIVSKSDLDENEFIKSKLNELYDKGIVLLKPMDIDRRKGIHNIVKDIPDVVSFSIGIGTSRQIVLRFKPSIEELIDLSEIAKEGSAAYKSKNYDLCIEKYRKLLNFGTPKAWVYAELGLAYMKKLDKDTAIDYLTIATGLAMEEQSDYDFTQLIASLKGMISPEEKKPRVKMNLEDFDDDIDKYYGIENIHEIADMISSGISLDEICTKLKIDDNQKAVISLILAREYYTLESYFAGDYYFKKAANIRKISSFTNMLLEEVRKNKKFYKNRFKEDHKKLLLSPKENH